MTARASSHNRVCYTLVGSHGGAKSARQQIRGETT